SDQSISPDSCMEQFIACSSGTPDCLPLIIEPDCNRETSSKRSYVGQSSVVPKKRVLLARVWTTNISCQSRLAYNLTLVVCALRTSEGPTKGAEIRHPAVIPKKRV